MSHRSVALSCLNGAWLRTQKGEGKVDRNTYVSPARHGYGGGGAGGGGAFVTCVNPRPVPACDGDKSWRDGPGVAEAGSGVQAGSGDELSKAAATRLGLFQQTCGVGRVECCSLWL
jgi:hypothetical protein